METFMTIVFLVFGILQIILFFKIWGMTNNVKKIKEAFLEKDFPLFGRQRGRKTHAALDEV